MNVTDGIRWVLTCTTNFDETVAFFRDVMGMTVADQGRPTVDTQFSRYALFTMADGFGLEIVEPQAQVGELLKGPIVSISVDDVSAARAEMQSKGVAFVAPVFTTPDGWGWTYFRAPDGAVYQIQGPCSAAGPGGA